MHFLSSINSATALKASTPTNENYLT